MKENQRIRISKQCIRESLIRLLQTNSLHKISITEICEGAEINRATFYKYYGSQYDVLKEMENEALLRIDEYLKQKIGDNTDIAIRTRNILIYIQDNIELFRLLINNTVDTDFPQKLISLPIVEQILNEQLTKKTSKNEFDYIYAFITGGSFSILKKWLNKENREPANEIVKILMSTKAFG